MDEKDDYRYRYEKDDYIIGTYINLNNELMNNPCHYLKKNPILSQLFSAIKSSIAILNIIMASDYIDPIASAEWYLNTIHGPCKYLYECCIDASENTPQLDQKNEELCFLACFIILLRLYISKGMPDENNLFGWKYRLKMRNFILAEFFKIGCNCQCSTFFCWSVVEEFGFDISSFICSLPNHVKISISNEATSEFRQRIDIDIKSVLTNSEIYASKLELMFEYIQYHSTNYINILLPLNIQIQISYDLPICKIKPKEDAITRYFVGTRKTPQQTRLLRRCLNMSSQNPSVSVHFRPKVSTAISEFSRPIKEIKIIKNSILSKFGSNIYENLQILKNHIIANSEDEGLLYLINSIFTLRAKYHFIPPTPLKKLKRQLNNKRYSDSYNIAYVQILHGIFRELISITSPN